MTAITRRGGSGTRGSAAGPHATRAESGRGQGDGHAGRGGLPHWLNLRRGQAVGLADEVAERALQRQGFGGKGAGGFNGSGVFVPQCVKDGDGLVSIGTLARVRTRFVVF